LKAVQCNPVTNNKEYVFCSYIKKIDQDFGPAQEIFKEWLHR